MLSNDKRSSENANLVFRRPLCLSTYVNYSSDNADVLSVSFEFNFQYRRQQVVEIPVSVWQLQSASGAAHDDAVA